MPEPTPPDRPGCPQTHAGGPSRPPLATDIQCVRDTLALLREGIHRLARHGDQTPAARIAHVAADDLATRLMEMEAISDFLWRASVREGGAQ